MHRNFNFSINQVRGYSPSRDPDARAAPRAVRGEQGNETWQVDWLTQVTHRGQWCHYLRSTAGSSHTRDRSKQRPCSWSWCRASACKRMTWNWRWQAGVDTEQGLKCDQRTYENKVYFKTKLAGDSGLLTKHWQNSTLSFLNYRTPMKARLFMWSHSALR